MTSTFSWTPDWAYTGQHKPRVFATQFGDGYVQRLINGINTDLRTWNLSFSVRTLVEINAIEAFLVSMQGATAFYFPLAGLSGQALVICPQWTPPSPAGPGNYTMTATFNEVVA